MSDDMESDRWFNTPEMQAAAWEGIAGNPVAQAYEAMQRGRQRATEAAVRVHLVIFDRGGLSGAYLDEFAAHRAAQVEDGGVVVTLPATADYRTQRGELDVR